MNGPADLTYPPEVVDPFAHGTCRRDDCENPAVFEGGLCADHVVEDMNRRHAEKEALLPVGPKAPPRPHRPSGLKANRAARRKAASASQRRNRR